MRQSNFMLMSLLIVGGLSAQDLHAQATVLTAGGEATGSGGTASYSVGYLAYATASGPGGTVTTGPQQPVEIFRLATATANGAFFRCTLHPNPTAARVTLTLDNEPHKDYSFQLCDALGRVLMARPLSGPATSISLEQLPANGYLLRVIKGGEDVQVFKVIKY